MKSIDRLVAEHDIIERGLTVLQKAIAGVIVGMGLKTLPLLPNR